MEGDCVGVEGSWENGVCLPWNQPVIPGEGVPERVGDTRKRGRGKQLGAQNKFKLKGQDTVQVLLPLSSPPLSSWIPVLLLPLGWGWGVLWRRRTPVGRQMEKKLRNPKQN